MKLAAIPQDETQLSQHRLPLAVVMDLRHEAHWPAIRTHMTPAVRRLFFNTDAAGLFKVLCNRFVVRYG